ncbi:P-loop containing nucleoside triphosphate hydrolase protein, partial [Endogone sp. FLAS-F59071]
MKKAAETLRTILAETYNIVVTEVSPEGNKVDMKLPSASAESDDLDSTPTLRTYQKSLTSVYMEGEFIGREKELETLSKLLHDDTHHYITIKGFGGMGKTCLALQAAKNFNSGDILALSLVGTPTLNSVSMKIAQFLSVDAQPDAVIEKLNGKGTVLFYLDNMEDIKNANDQGDQESKTLMKFFRRMPKNVKILATSRVALGWPNEEIVELDGLTPHDGMQVFRQWISQRNGEVDDDSAMKLSGLVHGHSLSLRLLGGVFNNCKESMEQFLSSVLARLPKVVDNDSTVDRHESINACIKYSFSNLDPALGSTLGQLKAFEIPFTKTLAERALG